MEELRPDDGSAPAETTPARPLGRGLEQISHLFLKPQQGRPVEQQPREEAPGTQAGPRTSACAVLFRAGPPPAKDRVVSVLRDNPGALESGLRAIDTFVSCPPYSDIDVLACDQHHQLTVVDVDMSLNDALCVRGLAHCDWLRQNLSTVRRLYPGVETPGTFQSRLFLVAARFSPLTLSAARQIGPQRIRLFRYHSLEMDGVAGIFFEPVEDI